MKNIYSISQVAAVINGEILHKQLIDNVVKYIFFDSRLLVSPENSLFFALTSFRNDGHRYIQDLYNKGVRAFVVSEMLDGMDDASFILVKDTRKALQQLAAFHRSQFNIPIIAITGSNGKTIVKEWLYQLLSPSLSVVRSPKSYNSQIGVPLSVWQLNENHQLAIFEAGISRPDEMQNLQEIIRPTIGVFTNIGQAHGRNFSSNQQKINEKLKLFKDVDLLVYCTDQQEVKDEILKTKINTFSWSRLDKSADLFIEDIQKSETHSILIGVYKNRKIEVTIPFSDDASIENAIHCLAIMLIINIPDEDVVERMKKLSSIAMRMELKSGVNNCLIINDSYNADINALTIALDFMNQQRHHNQRVVILSDILQSELPENELYSRIANLLKSKGVDILIGIGETISHHQDNFAMRKYFYPSTKDFLAQHDLNEFRNQIILIKGARDFGFEHISKILQEKAHETVLEINLDNLVKNMNYYRAKLDSDTKLMVMVKAFGYGSGNYEVSNVLEFHHADYLTVAFADEGVDLRRQGITLPIMVMSPEKNTFETIIKNNLEPEVYSFRCLSQLEEAVKCLEAPLNEPIKIHVKLDTGMHRLGFLPEDVDTLIERLKANPNIKIQSIFSHFAGADSPSHDDFTMHQIHVFEEGSSKIIKAFPYKIIRHILNTAGITRFTHYQYDMARLGIGIYGIASCEEDRGKLHTVISLKSSITQIKNIPEGESIGYNRHGFTHRPSRIGVVPIGYADGLPRLLGNGNGIFYVNEKPAPIIGDICMDMCMIDLTGIDPREDDTVIIFDENHPVEIIAKACKTISYEILTGISQRVKRVYFQE